MGNTCRMKCAAMAVHDALGRGQTDAYAGEFVLPVQALERLKEFPGVGHVEAGAVIRDTVKAFTPLHFGIDTDYRLRRACGVLPGVAEQISHYHLDHPRIPPGAQAGL